MHHHRIIPGSTSASVFSPATENIRLPAIGKTAACALALTLAFGLAPASWAASGGAGGSSLAGAGGSSSASGPEAGAQGTNGNAGGAAGTAASINGENASTLMSGPPGGGGAGYNGNGSGTSINLTSGERLIGGNGGAGGSGLFGGGGGGAGGNGAGLVELTGESFNAGLLTGGKGGAGGDSSSTTSGGQGGQGGSGVAITSSDVGGARFTNTGTIRGGNGGNSYGFLGLGSAGGTGIEVIGNGVTIINAGTVSGGYGSSSYWEAGRAGYAVRLAGNSNVLEIQNGSDITGIVLAGGTDNTLTLGGDEDSLFNASEIGASAKYQGFSKLSKTGSSTWTLSGSTTDATPWEISEGTLIVADSDALGMGDVTVNGGVLATGGTGQINIGGDYTQSEGELLLTITDEETYDHLNIGGELSLQNDFTLNLQFEEGFTLAEGMSFEFFTFDSLDEENNTFSEINLLGLDSNLGYTFGLNSENHLVLTFTAVPESRTSVLLILGFGLVVVLRFRASRRSVARLIPDRRNRKGATGSAPWGSALGGQSTNLDKNLSRFVD